MNRLVLFCIFLISGVWGHPLSVSVKAHSAILINAETGAVLFEKNSHEKRPPASTTKVATALFAIEKSHGNFHQVFTPRADQLLSIPPFQLRKERDKHPAYRQATDGSSMQIKMGERFTLETLLYGLLLKSANDAANVIAANLSPSIEEFVQELNQFVHQLGARDTHFLNPHGYDFEGHVSTAYDQALIMKNALQNPLFRKFCGATSFPRKVVGRNSDQIMQTYNKLLIPGKYYYSKAKFGKSGYHTKSGYCLVTYAEEGERKLIAVILGAENSHQRYIETTALFEAAFKEKKIERKLFSSQYDPFHKEIPGAKTQLAAHLSEDLILSYFPSEEPKLTATLYWHLPKKLPITKGDYVGEVRVVAENQVDIVLASAPLYAMSDVHPTLYAQFKDLLKGRGFIWLTVLASIIFAAAIFHRRKVLKKAKELKKS